MADINVRKIIWSVEEVEKMLIIVRDKEVLKLLDGKRYRGIEVYKSVAEEMAKHNYIRTAEQIRTKLKHLRKDYIDTKKHNSVSGANRRECAFYELLDEIFHERPVVITPEHGVESGSAGQGLTSEVVNNSCENESNTENPPKRQRNTLKKQIVAAEEEILKKNQEWWEREVQKQREYEKEMFKEFQKTLKETVEIVLNRLANSAKPTPSPSSSSSELQNFVTSFNPEEDD